MPFSFRRTILIAGNTLREATRQRAFLFSVLLILGVVLSAKSLRVLNFGGMESKFLLDFGFGTIGFFGAVVTIIATSQLVHREIELRTVLTLLAKPMWRAEFLLGKFLGAVAVSGGFCAVLTIGLVVTLWTSEKAMLNDVSGASEHPQSLNYLAVAAAGFAQWLKFAVLSALTLLIASFSRTQLFSTAAGFLVLVIGHLQFIAQASVDRVCTEFPGRLLSLLPRALPDFQSYDLSQSIESGTMTTGPTLWRLAAYTVAYVGFILIFAVSAFRRREL